MGENIVLRMTVRDWAFCTVRKTPRSSYFLGIMMTFSAELGGIVRQQGASCVPLLI